MTDQDTTNVEMLSLTLDRLRTLRIRVRERHENEMGFINEAIENLKYVRDNPAPPPPPRKVKKYVNLYSNGLGQQLFDTASAAEKAGRRYGWKMFGTYFTTLPVEATVPPTPMP